MKQITTNQIVENKIVEQESKREGNGQILAISHNVYRLQNTDTFYVESERSDNIYYFVRYNFSGLKWCSCPYNSTRGIKCKHQFAIEYAIRLGTLKDIEKLPAEAKRYGSTTTAAITSKSYRDDDYDF
jgi:predicted nucleic acid-binding Zn finger protein